MSSNMLAGERRWASARRGGMTVLGKVAVPKPLNLPSQRLENHGVDPSVEIVPKGTIGWGSRPSSSGSNAWVSSSQSPNADGRPSSGGSGTTRPSTAGSCDKTHEPVASAWGSNSRPSSASGAFASNHSSSTSLRPRSAETRPNSSQLSRFADHVSESSVAWGPSSAAEKLSVKSTKGDGFSLSSGDFPTLGTEKDNTMKNFESQDHGRPSSASSRVTPSREGVKYHSVNTWRPDGSQMEDDIFHPSMEKWRGESPQYFNLNIAPQHFDTWRGPAVNAPAGGWYRGPPRGPAFGAPGGYPMEPFPYYRPQVPPPGGPRGPHPKNGEFYQGPPGPPHMPESYARPGMPFRPGFYQGPPGPPGPMAFEGYYGPPNPMRYHNNERDIPYMGLPGGHPVYNGFPGPNGPDTDFSHGRHKEWDRKEEGENWEHNNVQSRRNDEWGADDGDAERDISVMKRAPSDNRSYRDCYSDNVNVNDDGWTNNSASPATFPPQMQQQSNASERELPLLPANKDPVLMRKIDGLNAKIRTSGGRNVGFSAYNREDQKSLSPVMDQKTNNNTARDVVHNVPEELIGPSWENQIQPIVVVPRRTYHGGQGRVDHHGKGKLNNQDNDGWRRKPLTPEFVGAPKASNMDSAHSPSFVGEPASKLLLSSVAKVEGESVAEECDSIDVQAQRAKMRELAKQRALQLQKEEEERIREQKAKALAKLEELNRRTQTGETAIEKISGDAQREEEESQTAGDALMGQAPSRHTVSESDIAVAYRENCKGESGKSDEVSVNLPPDAPQDVAFESNASLDGHTSPIKENSGDDRKVAVQSNDVGPSMHKRTGYKQKQQKSFNENSVPNSASEVHKNDSGTTDVNVTLTEASSSEARENIESNVHDTSKTGHSTTTIQRKKVNKSGKNKHKLETQAVPATLPVTSDKNPENKSIPESKALEPSSALPSEESQSRSTNNWKPQPLHRMTRSQQAKRFADKVHGSEVIWAPVRTHNKAQDSVEATEKSTVESTEKSTVESAEKSTVESTDLMKSDNAVQDNSFKGKRAEMERYVPKPVAKELAQQVSVPLSPEVPVTVQFGSVDFESTQNVSSTNAFVGSVSLEIKEGDGRHSKHKKEQHGHWRQRGTRHSPTREPKHIEQSQLVTSDKSSVNSEINASSNVDTDMSSNTATVAAVSRSASVKDHQGSTGRGKRRTPAPRRTGNYPDHENTNSADMDESSVQLAAPVVNYNDRTVNIREHLGTGEQTSQWKPKSHTNSTNNQHMYKPVANETVINKLPKKAQPSQRNVQVHDKESSNFDNSLHDSSNVAEESMPGHHHQGFNREKKYIPTKGRSSFPNQDPVVSGESDFGRTGSRSNRYARGGYEFHGDSSSGQDNRSHNVQRQRQYEYQPVGPTKGGNLEKHDELTDGANHGGQRFGERGQSQSKRGGNNFRRQGGAARVESGQH